MGLNFYDKALRTQNKCSAQSSPPSRHKEFNTMKGQSIECLVNGVNETIRFSPYQMTSERMTFEIVQEYGLDTAGKLSQTFVPFEDDSTEALLIEVVKTGQVQKLVEHGLILCERPSKGEISRNIALYDPKTKQSYTIGGLGYIAPNPNDHTHFVLKDPLLNELYAPFQEKSGNNVGGTKLVNNDGFVDAPNKSIVGTIEYNTGPYHVVRKILENEKLKGRGINAPTFIAAGPINNMADGKYGFSIYRSALTPEYLINLTLFLDERANFKKNFQIFLESKYSQLANLHRNIGESHGQPSNTNTLTELDLSKDNDNLRCQIKDFQTNHPLPTLTDKTITDGLSPIPVGYSCKKSPHVAALIYDLQHALTQELNVLFLPLSTINNLQEKFNFMSTQAGRLLRVVADAYDIASHELNCAAIDFAIHRLHALLTKGVPISEYNKIIAGVFVHAWFAKSERYKDQIDIFETVEDRN